MNRKSYRAAFFILVFLSACFFCIADSANGLNAKAVQVMSQSVESSKNSGHESGVKRPELEFLTLKQELKAGKEYPYKIRKKYVQGSVVFHSSNEETAVISPEGILTAKMPGSTWITASAQGCSTKMKVTVLPKKTVVIDPGHSANPARGREPEGPGSSKMKWKDSGGTAGVSTGTGEYEVTLKIALTLQKHLYRRGYQALLTREDNQASISNAERALAANREKADIFVRIHADGCEQPSVSGASAMYPTQKNAYIGHLSRKSRRLSDCMLQAMCQVSGAKNRGCFGRDDLAGLNWAAMPVTLIETGFLTNPDEDRRLQEDSYQEKLAAGMAEGIDAYFGYK